MVVGGFADQVRHFLARRGKWSTFSRARVTEKTEEDVLRLLLGICALIASIGAGLSDEALEIKIGYLREAPSRIRIALIDGPAGNDGLAGAQLATEHDNATA